MVLGAGLEVIADASPDAPGEHDPRKWRPGPPVITISPMNTNPRRLLVRDRRPPVAVAILLTIAALGVRARAQTAQSASARPAAPRLDRLELSRLTRIDDLMDEAIRDGQCPGGVVLVGLGDKILWRKAYGNRRVEPDREEMTVQTIFDMASCTKIIATATSVAILIDRGRVALSDPVAKYIPEFAANGKDEITVEQLLTHASGLIPDNSLKDYADGPEEAIKKIYGLGLNGPPGTFAYSDLNYIVLGELVSRVAGMPLDEFARREIFVPAGMRMTTFRPPHSWQARCAPTEKRNGTWIVGEVHDPRAYALGGVAGHAGLFSTADDVARWCRMILNGGEIDGTRILSARMVAEMTRPRAVGAENRLRGLGFDILTGYSSPRGELFPPGRSFGHTGFTGTSLWIDPASKMYVIILTNSVHPNGKGNVIALRRRIGTVAASAVYPAEADRLAAATGSPLPGGGQGGTAVRKADPMHSPIAAAKNAQVLTGLDVLVRDGFRQLAGRNVGVITNHTARSRDGQFIVDLLAKAPNVKLVALFAPEHGFRGILDEKVQDEKDPATGLTIYSLYGKTNTPTEEMLKGVDTLVFDIQDVGARFYTYETTMGNCMKAAARHGIRYVVLDRPNPIRGLYVGGPIADADRLGFTAFAQMPVAHGMTMGELATMWNAELKIGADLTVIRMENWTRDMWYDQTGLLWINPSPNMRNLNQALLYPGVCLIEATNMSVGRGTDQPFETFGAPWVEGRRLAAALNEANLPGVRFIPIEFTPARGSKFGEQKCGGVHVLVTNRDAVDPVLTGITIVWHLRTLFGEKFDFAKVNNLLANAAAMKAIREAKDPAAVPRVWQGDLEAFRKTRAAYLLYP